LDNLKAVFSNTRSRVVIIFTGVILLFAVVIGIGIFSRNTEVGQARLAGTPGIKSVVGGFDQPVSPEYAKLLEQQNKQRAQVAFQTQGSAVPTIVSAQEFPTAPNQNAAQNVCNCANCTANATNATLQTTGAPPAGAICSDGTVRDANGNIIGKTGLVAPGGLVYDKEGKIIGSVGPDGKVRNNNGNVIGTLAADGTVRDANGNVIGTTSGSAQSGGIVGKPVYDNTGKLLGYVGADNQVRDATGHVIGTASADGQVRDANGNVVGKVATGATPGSLIFDKTGHLLGTVGADGKVRDASGKVIGTAGADGQVRDAAGKVIGSVSPAAGNIGAPVYDDAGHLLGAVSADGKVRDASGKVIGTVSADGQVRDMTGKILGKVTPTNGSLAAPKTGSLVYDRNGRVIGTVSPDGKARDTNGNVIGTVGADGIVRDGAGNIVGSATTATPGTAVYDPQGRLLGTVSADGKVRDANGNVVGNVGQDGVVRDANGKPIGRTTYIAPGSAVFGTDGKLLGSIGPDGHLIPATLGPSGSSLGISAGSTTSPQAQAAARQQQQALDQKTRQLTIQMQAAMSGQMSQLLASWAPPSQQVVVGVDIANGVAGAAGAAGIAGGAGGTAGSSAAAAFVKAGTIMFAVLDTAVNSDEPGPVMATITEGKLKGGKLLGTMSLQGQNAMLSFNVLNLPGAGSSLPVNVVAIDPGTARTAISSDTDNHYMLRYGTLFASSFLSGYAQALAQSGSTTTITLNGIVHQIPPFNSQQKIMMALGNVGQQYSNVLGNLVNTPPTVKIYAGTGVGILFLSDMQTPSGV
jgi:YD repeat-containing protein